MPASLALSSKASAAKAHARQPVSQPLVAVRGHPESGVIHSSLASSPSSRSLVNASASSLPGATGTVASTITTTTTPTTITAGVVFGSASTNTHPDAVKHSSQPSKKTGSSVTVTKNSASPAAALPSRIPVLMSRATLPNTQASATVSCKTASACHSHFVSRLPVPVASASPLSAKRYSASSSSAAARSLASSASRRPIPAATGRRSALRPVDINITLATKGNCKIPCPSRQGSSPLVRDRRAAAPSSSFNLKNWSASSSERVPVGATEDMGTKKSQKSPRAPDECWNKRVEPVSCSRDHPVTPTHAPPKIPQQLHLPASVAVQRGSQCDKQSKSRRKGDDGRNNSSSNNNPRSPSKIPQTPWGKVRRALQSLDISELHEDQVKAMKRISLILALRPKGNRNRNSATRANNAGRIRYMTVSKSSELTTISEEMEVNENCAPASKRRVLSITIESKETNWEDETF